MAVDRRAPRMTERAQGSRSLVYDPRIRGFVLQALVLIALVGFVWWGVTNAIDNLTRAHVASGFEFLNARAGFDISQTLIQYSPESSYARAFLVALLNTLLVGVVGIVFASLLGFAIGVALLSK